MEGHLESKYYLNSHKDTPERSFPNDKVKGLSSPTPYPNDNIRQSRRDSTESIAGQSPTLTDSQQKDFIPERERIKLNNILHTGEITNNNISTFSDYEFADSSFVEDVLDDSPEITKCLNASEIEKGCCYLI